MLGVALGLLAGCTPRTDPRLATPEGTLETLLSAYALDDLPQAEIRRRLASGRRLSLRDPEAWRICFDDLRTPQDEGVAGFVLGAVATHKDVLRFEGGQDRTLVRSLGDAASDRVIVLRRRPSGWKIVLRESVPREVRRSLYAEYARIAARTP
ncbi:MAG TPA: hypothetical protein RMF84_01250 [Polyangiaceae bacterium LLY-WYZ-14_1]|nr:hypothetical protein [Polyangiaceae bacterium LLY-WYZ-14_1]